MNSRILHPLTALTWLAIAACGSSSKGDPAQGGSSGSIQPGNTSSDDAGESPGSRGDDGSEPDQGPAGDDATDDAGGPGDGDGEPGTPGDAAPRDAATHDGGSHDASTPPAGDGGPTGGCSGSTSGPLVGWASVSGMGVSTTTGGAGGPTVTVSTLADLNTNAAGTTARVIEIHGTIAGNVTVGSNKTLVGTCGAEIHGHVQMTGSANVIVRNLTVVGYDCTDNPSDCSGGADGVSVERSAHHLWFDHDDISDGSDGNLDITHASDFITISWTRFHYSGRRTDPAGAAGGHQFSNLIGHSDSNASEDTGHLRVTFHHDWWADNVVERMPRVRFGQVHLFDNLYTATGNDYCVGVGVSADIRDENDVFVGVKNPIDSQDYSNGASAIASSGDLFQMTTGTTQDIGGAAFTPPYTYALDPASDVASMVKNGAGPQ
jgi:pectate lyase